jgi:hypothetical protein
MKIIAGKFPTTTPVIAANLSVFMVDGALDADLSAMLRRSPYDEDWNIGEYLRNKPIAANGAITTFTIHTGQTGEVFNPLRARTSQAPLPPRSEAELLFNIISRKKYVGNGYQISNYRFLSNLKEYVDKYELIVSRVHTAESDSTGHQPGFSSSAVFTKLLQRERGAERRKVATRQSILKRHIELLASGLATLPATWAGQIKPYVEYFPEEIEKIKYLLARGTTPDHIVERCVQNAEALFRADSPIHGEIARLRALNTYAITHNINLPQCYKEGRLDESEYLDLSSQLCPDFI